MRDDGCSLEETCRTHAFGAVDDLRWECECSGGDVFAEGADGAEGEDGAYAEGFERGDVGAGGYGGGGDAVSRAVSCEEGDEGAGGEGGDGYGG